MILPSLSPMERTITLGVAAAVAVIATAFLVNRLFPPERLAEFPLLEPVVAAEQRLIVSSAEDLEKAFNELGYGRQAIGADRILVPHLLLREWPDGFEDMKRTKRKKTLFIRSLLPLILHVNGVIQSQRRTLERLIEIREAGSKLSHRERTWLKRLAKLYRTKPEKTSVLLLRVAPIPPSLAITQAAIETGWGKSRFARDGNAMFGQWTYDAKKGLRPLRANAGTRHAVKTYDRLVESAWDYARNLNTNPAYSALRRARAAGVKTGHGLAGNLDRYSERGPAYVTLVRKVMKQNNLSRLDKARLGGSNTFLSRRK